jgi:hypothetical protein
MADPSADLRRALAALTWIRVRRLGLWAILTGMACVILGYGIAWWRQERPRR